MVFGNRNLLLLSGGAIAVVYFTCKFLFPKIFRMRKPKKPRVYVCDELSSWILNEKDFVAHICVNRIVGLDCEWVTSQNCRKPVALLQLATADGFCVLIRLCNIPVEEMPLSLKIILADRNVLKLGVGIHEDAKKLLLDYGLPVSNYLDLRYLVKKMPDFKIKNLGLTNLSNEILGVKMKKDFAIACSNWEQETLSQKQIVYAAEDAIAAAQIFVKLMEQSNINLELESMLSDLDSVIDVPYKHLKVGYRSETRINSIKPNEKSYKNYHFNRDLLRKKLMYENCQLQAPDGELLCCCDRKKVYWYLKRKSAVLISEEPLVARLTFEPSGRPILDNKYYVLGKENRCVVCGSDINLLRKFIVPSEYRKHFPKLMKRFISHDVVLVCIICHRKSGQYDKLLKDQLALRCNAPVDNQKHILDRDLTVIKSAANALVKSKNKIPIHRYKELENIVCDYFKVDKVTEDVLDRASKICIYEANESFVPHGKRVYQYFCKHGGLIQFETLWRKHFIDTMKPQFLPSMWSVDHNHQRLAVLIAKNPSVDFDVSILGLDVEK